MVKTRASKARPSTVFNTDDDSLRAEEDNDSEGSSDSDSDDNVMNVRFDDSDDEDLDDDLFLQYTDVVDEGENGDAVFIDDLYHGGANDEAIFSDAEYASDSLNSYDGFGGDTNDGVPKEAHPMFKLIKHMDKFNWHMGIQFPSREIFKDTVVMYAIQGGWQLKWLKFNNVRARIGCVRGCKFLLLCSKIGGVDTWQLKTVIGEHACERTSENKLLNSKWLAKRLIDKMRRNPKMKILEIMQKVKEKYTMEISKTVASRARKRALEIVHGSYTEQYMIFVQRF